MRTRRILLASGLGLLACGLLALTWPALPWSLWSRIRGHASIADRLEQYGPAARARLAPAFSAARVRYPPRAVALLAFKEERILEVHAREDRGPWRRIGSYPIQALSGKVGPKLAEGDLQVPEGVYAIESLNPNSRFHLALRLNYPNAFDRKRAEAEGRTRLGGDIMIHGNRVSIGCLAMGDQSIEDLFVLVADTGISRVEVVLAPTELIDADESSRPANPWDAELHAALRARLQALR